MRLRWIARMFAGVCILGAAPVTAQEQGLGGIVDAWMASPHGDYHSESFTHWNEEGAVPEVCATCHSAPGFADFIGADGSAAGKVDAPAPINAPVSCAACHSTAAMALDRAVFPSGVAEDGLGADAACTVCHMGREAGESVRAAVKGLGEDEVSADLPFLNIHYGIAATVMRGADVGGGFEYPGQSYAGRFAHVPSASSCTACHDPHDTQVAPEPCMACHRGVEELSDIRMRPGDYDGDGQNAGGIAEEIHGLHARLDRAIMVYAAEVTGKPIGYTADAYPYFFNDSDGSGAIEAAEAVYPNAYKSWTPRLLKAAYNFQAVKKDPGAYAHNPAYALQLLHDSLVSLGERVSVDLSGIARP
ncbi:polyheme membrane-associated cytochrome C [Marimonas lutisalis]|uniref:polyheme membrane-associated cytochrome C n=1 Tax=Marimonas lutisalis TaxID=2545756 RepID=UPI0010F48CFA|nr:polyheme membrane-associated cytochrome C [Marimonas lutisalis]